MRLDPRQAGHAETTLGRLMMALSLSFTMASVVDGLEPSFTLPQVNVTVVQGQEAVLKCTINNLGEHKVVWTTENGFTLSLNEKRITEDARFSVERPFESDWNLHIRNIEVSYKGKYVCQMSTTPVKKTTVLLIIHVPPSINDETSSSDMTVTEGDVVTLFCNASGDPSPTITWYRQNIDFRSDTEQIGNSGEILKIHNVSRDCGGIYICEAVNGIEPKQIRKMNITVHYPPEVKLRVNRMGQYLGKETFLQCEVTANPVAGFYWSKNGVDLTKDTRIGKYTMELYGPSEHKKTLSLRIREVEEDDFGKYFCHAENSLGKDKESMILYNYADHDTTPTPTRTPPYVIQPTQPPIVDRGLTDVGINQGFIGPNFPGTFKDNQHRGVNGLEASFANPLKTNVTVVRGQTAVLPCQVDNKDEYKVVWLDEWSTLLTYEDRRIIDDQRISIERPFIRDWNLHIRRIEVTDGGEYQCQINTRPLKAASVFLEVHVPPTVLVESERIEVDLGATARLACKATGTPAPVISWFRKSPDASKSLHKQIGGTGEVLLIHNTSVECGGTYFCRADNGVEPFVRGMIEVIVNYSEMKTRSNRIGEMLGTATVLECEYKPASDIVNANKFRWLKDGQLISDVQRFIPSVAISTGADDPYFMRLTIINIQPGDYGNYTCTAEDRGQFTSATISLYESEPPVAMVTKEEQTTTAIPTMSAPTDDSASIEDADFEIDVMATEGDPALLPCKAYGLHLEGGSDVKVTWRDRLSLPLSVNDVMITDDKKFKHVSVETEDSTEESASGSGSVISFMTIEPVDRRYTGMYTCSIDTGTLSRQVKVRLRVKVPPVVITDNFVKLNDTERYGLSCHAAGIPDPTVSWLWANNNSYIQSTEVLPLDGRANLYEQSFVCLANNSLGEVRKAVTPPVPGPPVNVTSVFVGEGYSGIRLSWEPAEVTRGTILEYRFLIKASSHSMDGGTYPDSLKFTYYSPAPRPTKYKVSIYAENEVGRGPSSDLDVILPGGGVSDIVTVQKGHNAALACKINNAGGKQFLWADKMKRVTAIGSVMMTADQRLHVHKVDKDTTHLVISSVTSEDEGHYHCALHEAPIKWTALYLTVE